MQNVNRKKKNFKLDFFEIGSNEVKSITEAKDLLNSGEIIRAMGYVEINGIQLLVRTAEINEIKIFKNIAKIYTNSMEYNVSMA